LIRSFHWRTSPADLNRSIEFYARLGFEVMNTFKPRERLEFYNPRGEFRVSDPDGYVVMIAHSD
jgi:hypothetical protein